MLKELSMKYPAAIILLFLLAISSEAVASPYNGGSTFNQNAPALQGVGNGGTGATNASDALVNLSGVVNVSACGEANSPSWCSGSDVGAWFTAACSHFGENYKYILDKSSMTYSQSSTIYCSQVAQIDTQGATLSWQSSSGVALVLARSGGITYNDSGYFHGVISYVPGYTAGNTNTCIFIGGDPQGVINAPTQYGDLAHVNGSLCNGFDNDVTFGNNAWNDSFFQSDFANHNNGFYAAPVMIGFVSNLSLTSNVLTATMFGVTYANWNVGDKVLAAGLTSTFSFLNGTYLTVASINGGGTSATFNVTHANVTSASSSGTLTDGTTNSGELIRIIDSTIANSNSGYGVLSDSNQFEFAISHSSIDFNAGGALGGVQAHYMLDDDHLEQTTGSPINLTDTTSARCQSWVHMNGGSFTVHNVGTINGFVTSLCPSVSSPSNIDMENVGLNSQSTTNYVVYTGGITTALPMVINNSYAVGGSLPANLTDATAPFSTALPGINQGSTAINTQSGSYILTIGDAGFHISMACASACNLTVPPNSSVAFQVGQSICFSEDGAGAVTLVAGSGVTLNKLSTLVMSGASAMGCIKQITANNWNVFGAFQ